MSETDALWTLWGKAAAAKDEDGNMVESQWHPLVCHMVDVMCVGEVLPYPRVSVAIETRLSRSRHEVKDGPVVDWVEKRRMVRRNEELGGHENVGTVGKGARGISVEKA